MGLSSKLKELNPASTPPFLDTNAGEGVARAFLTPPVPGQHHPPSASKTPHDVQHTPRTLDSAQMNPDLRPPQQQEPRLSYQDPQTHHQQDSRSRHLFQSVTTPSTPSGAQGVIERRLAKIVQDNGLQPFYDAQGVRGLSQRLAALDTLGLARRWNLPVELVYDLFAISLYDVCFFCDDSGSMVFEEDGERVDDLRLVLSRVADITSVFDDDGVVVRFMNSDVCGDFIKTAAEVQSLVAGVPFGGMTPLGTSLERNVLGPMLVRQVQMRSLAKPLLVIVITDGEPTGEPRDTFLTVIRRVVRYVQEAGYGRGALGIQVAQVGNDVRVQRFLADLDNDPEVGGNIDCTSGFELEQAEFARKGVNLTPELWLLKMCLGAIDGSYDEKD